MPGFVTFVLVIFTFSPNFFSIQRVIVCITRFAAALLLTVMTQSSAYLTKFNPLVSNSLSSSLSMILLSIGDRFPPCGVPLVVSSYFPFTITPAFRYLRISDSVSGSYISLPTRVMSLSCGTLSKNFSRSISTIYVYPSLKYSSSSITACWALRPGLKP